MFCTGTSGLTSKAVAVTCVVDSSRQMSDDGVSAFDPSSGGCVINGYSFLNLNLKSYLDRGNY